MLVLLFRKLETEVGAGADAHEGEQGGVEILHGESRGDVPGEVISSIGARGVATIAGPFDQAGVVMLLGHLELLRRDVL